MSAILFKYCCKKLAEEAEIAGEETLKKPAQFFKEPSKIDVEELQNRSSLKELEENAQNC